MIEACNTPLHRSNMTSSAQVNRLSGRVMRCTVRQTTRTKRYAALWVKGSQVAKQLDEKVNHYKQYALAWCAMMRCLDTAQQMGNNSMSLLLIPFVVFAAHRYIYYIQKTLEYVRKWCDTVDVNEETLVPRIKEVKQMTRISWFTNDSECERKTKFTREQLYKIVELMELDEYVRVVHTNEPLKWYKFHREELVLYMLTKFRTGNSHAQMHDNISHSDQRRWSYGYKFIVRHVIHKFRHIILLDGLNHASNVVDKCARIMRKKIQAGRMIPHPTDPSLGLIWYDGRTFTSTEDPLYNIFGLFDCKEFLVCRPGSGPNYGPGRDSRNRNLDWYLIQRAFYNGNKRKHSVKVFSVVLPNGLSFVAQPVSGRRNDTRAAQICNIEGRLVSINQHLGHVNPNSFYKIYGDKGFAGGWQTLVTPRRETPNAQFTEQELIDIKAMKGIRQAVEFSYCKVRKQWGLVTSGADLFMLRNDAMHVYEQIHAMFFFSNLHTCFSGSSVGKTLGMIPPSVDDYVRGAFDVPQM
jgi:DDE superfamily endonuclease